MKLGLLLTLSVAALVLNLSEGRIVSKCELRQKLQEVLPLPRKYGRYKDQILPSKHSHESSSQEKDNVKPNQGPAIYFGLFQLSDSYFCDSGNGSSKNLCNKNCSAFIDDNIEDDLECFANKGYWSNHLIWNHLMWKSQQNTSLNTLLKHSIKMSTLVITQPHNY
uniref:Glycosyl hydrolases family 22 (GH22) domain-containing protein n=1 Tax=Oryzias latipes TaxID=8090 RepID=A0A3P9MDX2_ORYLA